MKARGRQGQRGRVRTGRLSVVTSWHEQSCSRLFSVYRLRHIVQRYRQGLWALAAAVICAQLVPLHLHFHHAAGTPDAGVLHVLDLHVAGNATDNVHHGDAHVIDMSAETVVKQWNSVSAAPVLIACLLLLFVAPIALGVLRRPPRRNPLPRSLFAVPPPLRAPPRS